MMKSREQEKKITLQERRREAICVEQRLLLEEILQRVCQFQTETQPGEDTGTSP